MQIETSSEASCYVTYLCVDMLISNSIISKYHRTSLKALLVESQNDLSHFASTVTVYINKHDDHIKVNL